MNRTELEEMEVYEFYELPEMKLASKIYNADDDVEMVLIIRDIFESNCVNAKRYLQSKALDELTSEAQRLDLGY